jgi:outer membrane protein assembly factor BamA
MPGQPYQPGELRRRLADYVTTLRHRRYYEASGNAAPPVFNEDRTRADVTVEIQPGPLVTIEFAGDPLPKDKIDELVPIEREGSVDQDLLEDSARRLTEYLNQLGYWKAEVTPPERREADGRLTLVFNVKRGRLYHVAPGGVDVTGNASVPIEELRPFLKMDEGDVFVRSKLDAMIGATVQLYKTRGFATVQVNSGVNEEGDGHVKPVIVIKEGPRVIIGRVTISGNQAIPADRLTPLLTLKVGDAY